MSGWIVQAVGSGCVRELQLRVAEEMEILRLLKCLISLRTTEKNKEDYICIKLKEETFYSDMESALQ